jgi:hypothetical protein
MRLVSGQNEFGSKWLCLVHCIVVDFIHCDATYL